ncbi:MAG: 3'-5' exonuclease [Pseudomonadota bacterium]
MNVLVFDIETVPDTVTGARLYDLQGLSDADIARAMFAKRVQKTGGSDFLPLHLHRVVAISAVMKTASSFNVWSLGDESADEKEIVQRFYDGLDRYTPTLVSWNGSGFDLPVLHYRAMLNSVNASRYWENGDENREFRYNNYLSRYHWRHIDLMDVIAGFNARSAAPLDEVAVMLGFPGKLGMSGAAVWDTYQQGDLKSIRDYCETDVLNTYLVYLRWELTRGGVTPDQYADHIQETRDWLAAASGEHFRDFLSAWPSDQ